jgi:hypothetical protein
LPDIVFIQLVFGPLEQSGGKVPYEQIRLVVAHLNTMRDTRTE